MLVYQFMPAEFALEDLCKRRLKVSLLTDMNDPFELMGARLDRAALRVAMRRWREHMTTISRVLCFSRKYMNPLLWSHYADKHRGMCLGFEVPGQYLNEISYEPRRLELRLERELSSPGGVSTTTVNALFTTKYADWKYEDELRMFVGPEEVQHDGDLQFFPFGDQLALRRVVLGPRCSVTRKQVEAALQAEEQRAEIFPTRLAFKSFHVIRTPFRPVARKRKPDA